MSKVYHKEVTVYNDSDAQVKIKYWVSYEQGEISKIPLVTIEPVSEDVDLGDVHYEIKKHEGNDTFFE